MKHVVKQFCYVACIAALAIVGQGCFLSPGVQKVINVGGSQLPVAIPSGVLEQGEAAVRGYLAEEYPWAVPFVNQIVPPATGVPPGRPQFVQVPVTYSTNITLLLSEELAGSKTLDGAKVSGVVIAVKAKAGKVELPETETKTLTLTEFISTPDVQIPVSTTDTNDYEATPVVVDDTELNDNPALPQE